MRAALPTGSLYPNYRAAPAPGYRHRDTGAPGSVGYGYSRSSTVNGTNGMYLAFGATELYPSYSSSRAYGFQLRCLSE